MPLLPCTPLVVIFSCCILYSCCCKLAICAPSNDCNQLFSSSFFLDSALSLSICCFNISICSFNCCSVGLFCANTLAACISLPIKDTLPIPFDLVHAVPSFDDTPDVCVAALAIGCISEMEDGVQCSKLQY